MPYQVIKLGSFYIDGLAVAASKKGNEISMLRQGCEPTISHTISGKELTWIRPGESNILIADKAILLGVTWSQLNALGFVGGKMVNIDGQWFRCRLPKVGSKPGEANEWDDALNVCGTNNKLWHWKNIFIMGQEKIRNPYSQVSSFIVRGCKKSPRDYKKVSLTTLISEGCPVGFRPVLEIVDSHTVIGDKPKGQIITLEGQRFCLTIPGGNSICNDWDESTKAFKRKNKREYPWSRYGSWTKERRDSLPAEIVIRGSLVGGDGNRPKISSVHSVNPDILKGGFGEPIGFRPMLIPIDENGNMDHSVFSHIENGTVLQMYSLLMGNEPVQTKSGARAAKYAHYTPEAQMVVTDVFCGENYLIPWVIFNGKAISLRNLVVGVKWENLAEQGYC